MQQLLDVLSVQTPAIDMSC